MQDQPIRIPRYIQLAVKTDLDRVQMRHWMDAARAGAASGVLATVQTTDDQGSLCSVAMVHQQGSTLHRYRIPLTRDLRPEEVQSIVAAFAEVEAALDFDVETNETRIEPTAQVSISLDDARHIALCTALAKARHATWMRDRLADGWRFGVEFSTQEKTHPLLRPWEQIPDQFRKPDLASPQALLDLIQDQGFVIIARDSLDALKSAGVN